MTRSRTPPIPRPTRWHVALLEACASLTQAEAGTRLGVSQQTAGRYFTGHTPDAATIVAAEVEFGVSASLLGRPVRKLPKRRTRKSTPRTLTAPGPRRAA